MTKAVNNNTANTDAYRTAETTSNTVSNNKTVNDTNENNRPIPLTQYASQNGTFNFEGQMRRFELNRSWMNRTAAVNDRTVSDNGFVSKTATFTPKELGIVARSGKLPKTVKVSEPQFEQKLFSSYGLDRYEPQTEAILKNIFQKENPADAIDWKVNGKPTTEFTATLNADGNYEINYQLNKTTDKQLNQAVFNRAFFPNQPLDPNLLKVLGNNTSAGNFQQTAESPDLTEMALDLTQMGLDVVGIFEPTPFADLTNTGISAVRGNWGDAALSVIGVIPYIGDVAKLGKIPKWLKAIDKISGAIDKFKQIAVNGGKGAEAVKEFVKKAKSVIDSLPIEKLPDSLRDAVKSVKKKIDDFFASVKKSEKIDDVPTKVENPKPAKTDNVTTTKPPGIEPPKKPKKPEIEDNNVSGKKKVDPDVDEPGVNNVSKTGNPSIELTQNGKVYGKFVRGESLEIISSTKLYGGNKIALNSGTTTVTGALSDVESIAVRGRMAEGLTKMGDNPGGINILRSPLWKEIQQKHADLLKSGDATGYWKKVTDEFWETANRPWLDEAIKRGDSFRFVSKPTDEAKIFVTDKKGGFIRDADGNRIKSIFGREVDYLQSKGYTFLPDGTAVRR